MPIITGNTTIYSKIANTGIFLPQYTSDPINAANGQIYYNTVNNKAVYYKNGTWTNIGDESPKLVEFKLWGAGGGSGSQQRAGTQYQTTTYYAVKQGGAGGFVYAKFQIKPGTQLILSVGGAGRGALQQGNPSSASGGTNGGGNGTYTTSDASGGGGGYTGVFAGATKSQTTALAISPGGGGGGGGPGYPSNSSDQANGGGGIYSVDGTGNAGARNFGTFVALAGGGTPTSGGVGGDSSVSDGDGNAGSALQGGNGVYYGNSWGSGGGGGGGWFGGGSGCNDGSSWSGGGGGCGSAFVRGSGISSGSNGSISIFGITYTSHTFYTESYGSDNATYNAMRVPAGTSDSQYPGNYIGYGGDFNTSPPNGLNGYGGAICYSIDGGPWTTITTVGDTTITVT